jgi:hypothetical protein
VRNLPEEESSPAGSVIAAQIHNGIYFVKRNDRQFAIRLGSIVFARSFAGITLVVTAEDEGLFVPNAVSPRVLAARAKSAGSAG